MTSDTLSQFVPSAIIAASTIAAFVIGRLLAWLVRVKPKLRRFVAAGVVILSLGAAAFFVATRSSRFALLLPAAFVVGFLSDRAAQPPRIFPAE